ncbi:hypothetical protein [Methylocella sp.]|uniref:hypothetical protein n=1 Tax=Methylocella sp. TaxID=1978226 RepID=UPI003C14C7C3
MRKFDNFETHLGASLAVPLTEVQEQISKFIDADGAKVTQFFGDLATEISKTDWHEFGADIGAVAGDVKTAAEYIDDIVKKTVGWRVASDALIGVALAGWLLPVGVALGGIALALGKIAGVGGIPGALALGGAFEFGKWAVGKTNENLKRDFENFKKDFAHDFGIGAEAAPAKSPYGALPSRDSFGAPNARIPDFGKKEPYTGFHPAAYREGNDLGASLSANNTL